MKRFCFILFLTMFIVETTAAAVWAGPIGINVKPGSWSITAKNCISPPVKNIDLNCSYGLNDKLMLMLGYGTDTQAVCLGGRYVFVNNFAGLFNYKTSASSSSLCLGLGGKTGLSEELSLAGMLNDITTNTGSNTIELTGQAEYKPGSQFFVNGGFKCSGAQSNNFTTCYLLGAEWYPVKNFTAGLDYSLPSSGAVSTLTAVLKYAF